MINLKSQLGSNNKYWLALNVGTSRHMAVLSYFEFVDFNETEKAFKFIFSPTEFIWMPKQAIKTDKKTNMLHVAYWFNFNDIQQKIIAKYSSCIQV
jgi:hypothetical protein